MRLAAILLPCVAALSGCINMQNVERGNGPKLKSNEAIAVIGMHQRYRVHLQSGRVVDDVWHMRFANPEANLFPEDGYIVVKLPVLDAGEKYSIPMVLPTGIGLGPSYVPCEGTQAPAFDVKAGAVTYVGDISYDLTHEQAPFELSYDEERAKRFLSDAYPGLVDSLQTVPMVSLKVVGTQCRPSIIVPVYVPG